MLAPPGKPTVTMPMNTPRTVEFLVTEPSSVAGPPVEKFIVKYFPTGKEVEEKTKEKESMFIDWSSLRLHHNKPEFGF